MVVRLFYSESWTPITTRQGKFEHCLIFTTQRFTLHTIGIGDQVNEPLLRELARIGKGRFSKAKADLEDMKRVYATIANQLTIGQ
jgi:hypothetical protein